MGSGAVRVLDLERGQRLCLQKKRDCQNKRVSQAVRCAMIFFDMTDSSQIPPIAEPLFTSLGAEIELVPVMNGDDLRKGLEDALRSR
jgi:hypothetical protein